MDVWSRVAVVAVLASGTLYADDWTKSFVVGASPELRVETDDAADRRAPASVRKVPRATP